MGIWIDWYREWRKRQLSRHKVEIMAVAAFNRKISVGEVTVRAAHHWMSKTPQLSARRQLDQKRQERLLSTSSSQYGDEPALAGDVAASVPSSPLTTQTRLPGLTGGRGSLRLRPGGAGRALAGGGLNLAGATSSSGSDPQSPFGGATTFGRPMTRAASIGQLPLRATDQY